MPSRFARLVLHTLLVIAMVTASVAVPAQAATDALQSGVAAGMAAEMAGMPCDDEAAPNPDEMPCDCCTPASCDLSSCIGVACLPGLPRVVASVPAPSYSMPWASSARPSRIAETPLRPPIA